MVGGYSYKSVRDVPWFRNKLRRALLKNFEYVHSKDAEALRLQLDIISRQEEQDKKQAAAVLEHAKKRELALDRMYGQSGIGLGSVKSVSQQSENCAVGGDGESSSSFGVYVKGLPQRMLRENENDHELSPIRQLFGAWGEIRNIKVYKESVIVSLSVSNYNNDDILCLVMHSLDPSIRTCIHILYHIMTHLSIHACFWF